VGEITELIGKARAGDRQATERLFASLYDELKGLARSQLAGGGEPPMRATSLVHEAYCKLVRGATLALNDREHFYATASRTMRQILVDHIRARAAQRRGGHQRPESLDTGALQIAAGADNDIEMLALDTALDRLAVIDPALARVVELRFYGGLELPEISVLLERSERSLKRDWRRARAFLYREIAGEPPPA